MRDYGKVHTSFWESDTLRELDGDAKLLALYLLTSRHTHMAGVFSLPTAYAAHDLGWDSERLSNGFRTLSATNWLRRCDRTGWVWIVKFIKFNPPDNPNQQKAIRKQFALVPVNCSFATEVVTSEPLSNGYGNTPTPTPIPTPVLTTIPLDDGSEHPITAEDVKELGGAYPLIDVLAECRKARAWCLGSPANRKTKRGVGKFVNGWMARAQKDAEKNAPAKAQAAQPGGGRRAL
jgi:hypothetical protein